MTGHKILVLGEGQLCRIICWTLAYKGYQVQPSADPFATIEALAQEHYDLIIAKPAKDGGASLKVVEKAKRLNPALKVMLISDLVFPPEAYQIDVDDYLLLPLKATELWERVSRCLEEEVIDLEPANAPLARQATATNDPVSNRIMIALHDIRSSVVSTAASMKLLIRGAYGEMDQQVAKKLTEVYDKVQKMTELTDEFMQVAFSDNGQTESAEEVLDLRQDVIEPVLKELAPEIQGQQISINNRLDSFPDEVISIKGNKLTLKSVFRNLLNNGIKYGGPGGSIVINLEMQGSKYRLHVYNTGAPIPEDYRPLLFSKQLGRARMGKQDQGGLGMGLSLSRDLIQDQGGDMWYEPKVDGSNFVISLPRH